MMRRRGWKLFGVVVAMLVSGCAQGPGRSGRLQGSQPGAPSAAASSEAAPVWMKKHAPSPAMRARQAAATMDRLIGLNESELEKLLGIPTLEEDRAPNKLWVYRHNRCRIDVTLYPDVETRQFHALSYEVISDVHTAERTRECIAEFAARVARP